MDSSSVSVAGRPRASRVVILSNLDVAFEGYLRWTRQPDMFARTAPVYAQLAATHAYANLGIQTAALTPYGHGRARACPTRQGLSGTALIDPQTNVAGIYDLHEAGVHPVRKSPIPFDGRSKAFHRRPLYRHDFKDRVRIANRNRTDGHALPVDLECFCFFFGCFFFSFV